MSNINRLKEKKRSGLSNKLFTFLIPFTLITGVVLGLLMVGCQSSEPQNLEYETLVQDFGFGQGEGYGDENPDILVLASLEDIENPGLGVVFPPSLAEKLRTVDFQQNFIVFIFRGLLTGTSPKYTIEITNVIRQNNKKVVIQNHFGSPGPENIIMFGFSSPYHSILILKEGKWGRDIQFVLEVDGKKVSQHTHFIP